MAAVGAMARWAAAVRVATKEGLRAAAAAAAHREAVQMAVVAWRATVATMAATPGARAGLLAVLRRRQNFASPGPLPTSDAIPPRFRASSDTCEDLSPRSQHRIHATPPHLRTHRRRARACALYRTALALWWCWLPRRWSRKLSGDTSVSAQAFLTIQAVLARGLLTKVVWTAHCAADETTG